MNTNNMFDVETINLEFEIFWQTLKSDFTIQLEKTASESLLEAAISSGLTQFESVNAIKAGIKYGKNLVH